MEGKAPKDSEGCLGGLPFVARKSLSVALVKGRRTTVVFYHQGCPEELPIDVSPHIPDGWDFSR